MAIAYYESSRGLVAYLKRGWGDPVVLLHDLYPGASHEEFRRNIDALARQFTVYAIDLLGFGDSDKPRITYTAQIYQHLLRDFIVEVIGGPVLIVASGVSCGPTVALAVYNDSLVRKLVLICPPGDSTAAEQSGTMISKIQQFLLGTLSMGSGLYETVSSRYELRRYLETRYAKARRILEPEVEALHERANQPHALHAFVSNMTGQLAMDLPRWLRSVRCEVLIVAGEAVRPIRADQLIRPAAWSRGKRIEVIPDAAAWPHDEQSARFNKLVIEFLNAAPADQKGTA